MNGKDTARKIREKEIGLQDKKVLIVEGVDDVSALTILFNRHHLNWEQHWVIAPVGSKSNVQAVLSEESNWLGIVDRDEWGSDLIDQKAIEQPNLMPLPRFCLENYLINPDELWPAIPEAQQQKIQNGQQGFVGEMLEDLWGAMESCYSSLVWFTVTRV